ncbi:hypothetical protein B0H14DRAFT_1543185 [Mycena olivaceomarginata]|nr:hypothetical protein B0H14DRAFT_1543185 [Mycena olivaceomarginata]
MGNIFPSHIGWYTADGEVKWLGHYGQNGALLLNWTDSDPVIMTKNWVPTPENDSYRWNSDGRAVEDVEVARLAHPSDYTAYAVGENSFLDHKDSSLIFLAPRLSPHPVIVPPTLVFGATPSGSISFTSRGTITTSGTSSLLFYACETPEDVELAVSRVINPCSPPRCRVVGHTPGVLVLASAADKYPVEVAVVPMASSTPVVQNDQTASSLASLISGKPPFFIFSSLHRAARFVEEASDEKITFTTGQSGGQFILSPAHTVNHGEEQWRVGIMSSHSPHSLPVPTEGLPTPPPVPAPAPAPSPRVRCSRAIPGSVLPQLASGDLIRRAASLAQLLAAGPPFYSQAPRCVGDDRRDIYGPPQLDCALLWGSGR